MNMAVRQNLDINEGTSALFEQGYILRFLKKECPDVTKNETLLNLGRWEKQNEKEYRIYSKRAKEELESAIEKALKMKVVIDFQLDLDEGAIFFTL